MKKIYSLIASVLFLFVGSVQGQSQDSVIWESDGVNAETIIPGEENFYVLQQGVQDRRSQSMYMNNGTKGFLPNIDGSCVYNFIEDGTHVVGDSVFTVYVLKHVQSGQYLQGTKDSPYTDIKEKAFRFTIRKAKAYPSGLDDEYNYKHYLIYSHFTEEFQKDKETHGHNFGAEAAGAWVIASPLSPTFLDLAYNNVVSSEPNAIFRSNWFVYPVTKYAPSAFEQFLTVFDKYFANGINAEDYVVGTKPGCISQQLLDKLLDVYQRSLTATGEVLSDEQSYKLIQEIESVMEEMKSGIVPLTPGYYLLRSNFTNSYAFAGEKFVEFDKEVADAPLELTADNINHIWKFEDSEQSKGGFFIKNFFNKAYLLVQASRPTQELVFSLDDKSEIVSESAKQAKFFIKDNVHYLRVSPRNTLHHWGFDNQGNLSDRHVFSFEQIPDSIITALSGGAEQQLRNEQLTKLYHSAVTSLKSIQYANGITYDGSYSPMGKGLATGLMAANATLNMPNLTNNGAAFDNNLNTFYHTTWAQKDAPANQNHWVELNLGKSVSELVVKFTQRWQDKSHVPTRVAIVAGNDTANHIYTDTIFNDTIIYTYATDYPEGTVGCVDSTTYIGTIKMKTPSQFIRFVVLNTHTNAMVGEQSGPVWHLAEMRFYDKADCVENPSLKLIPVEMINEVSAAIAQAKKELVMERATQATYDRLEKALSDVLEAYPNPTELFNRIEGCRALYPYIFEKEATAGYYQPGTKDAFVKMVEEINTLANTEVLSSETINKLKQQLEDAKQTMLSRYITPEGGIYRLKIVGDNGNVDNPDPATNSYVAAANADVASSPVWAYANDYDITTRWNTIWKVEKNVQGKFAFKNLYNGLYMKNPYEGLSEEEQSQVGITTRINYSETPSYFAIQASPVAGQMMIAMKADRYMRGSSQTWVGTFGSPMVVYNDFFRDNRARFAFEPVTSDDDVNTSFIFNGIANAPQVVTLPISVANVYAGDDQCAYEVLGLNGEMLQFSQIANVIPAGTPFIVNLGEDPTIEVEPVAVGLEQFKNVLHEYNQVIAHGLVSAPKTIVPGAGYGYFYKGIIFQTEGKEIIPAGSGFFNNEIGTTEETGDWELKVAGSITSEGLAIEEIETPGNPYESNDVYTISGVKVRHNVKDASEIQNLPKGIYVLNGKKVFVR